MHLFSEKTEDFALPTLSFESKLCQNNDITYFNTQCIYLVDTFIQSNLQKSKQLDYSMQW